MAESYGWKCLCARGAGHVYAPTPDEFEGYTEEQLADEAARDFDDALKEAVSQVEGPRESRCRGWA